MLKAEIRNLYSERKDVKRKRVTEDKTNEVIERKYLLTKEMLERVTMARAELERDNFRLRSDLIESERCFQTLKNEYVRFTELSLNNVQSTLAARNSSANVERGMKQSGQGVGKRGAAWEEAPRLGVHGSIGDGPLILDAESIRLKIDSLTTERDFLRNENKILKQKFDDLYNDAQGLRTSLKRAQSKLQSADKDLKAHNQVVRLHQMRYARAEKVSAFLEGKLKEAKPNVRIDYSQISPEIECSTQLLATLLDVAGMIPTVPTLTQQSLKPTIRISTPASQPEISVDTTS
ncbi:hypothetical protein HDU93_000596 [Gonapodya sp. JEL0774]|nr:hypothetical protein HDU93_000596 [Gonapodya sp. JEL0774]